MTNSAGCSSPLHCAAVWLERFSVALGGLPLLVLRFRAAPGRAYSRYLEFVPEAVARSRRAELAALRVVLHPLPLSATLAFA